MQKKFKESLSNLTKIDSSQLCGERAPKILVAVSGGMDSMCMAHLFSTLYLSNFAIATVNFSLRGEESDADQELVKSWADSNGILCFSTTFDTNAYSKENKISTQMAARELRYNWFDKLIKEHDFDYLAVAHNLNDSVETFFLNILRGTGLKGMTGIPPVNGYIIRPLLPFTRREIAEYVKKFDVPFREDSSNAEVHYSRNRLRNMVFPEFEMINHSFLHRVERDISNLQAAQEILEELLSVKKKELLHSDGNKISIEKLCQEKRSDYWLYMILGEYGFSYEQVLQIDNALKEQPGKEFHSDSHLVIKDREWLLIYPKGGSLTSIGNNAPIAEEMIDPEIAIEEIADQTSIILEERKEKVTLSLFSKPQNFKPYRDSINQQTVAQQDLFSQFNSSAIEPVQFLDFSLISFPVIIRRWRAGDKFIPLGMKGFKKVSDYLTDLKLDKVTKAGVMVITSGDKIIALPGYRIDERFKVTPMTGTILQLSLSSL